MFGLFNRKPVNIILRGIKSGALVVKQIPVKDRDGYISHAYTITRVIPGENVVITIRRDVEVYCYWDNPEIGFTAPEWMTFRESRKIFHACIDHHNDREGKANKARMDKDRAILTEQLTREIPNV